MSTTVLARQQQMLLDALLAWPADNAMKVVAENALDARARGLKAYQANGHALAERALHDAYPVLAQLLGTESFGDLARALWHAQPPTRGDVACWGEGLPAFLAADPQLQDEPYLGDVARAEWALHRCASAADAAPDLASLALLQTEDPGGLTLVLAPGCTVLRSAWPVAAILGAHTEGTPSLAEAGALLRAGVAQDVLVWREGLRPRSRTAMAGEVDLLLALFGGAGLAGALDQAPALDFGQWLPLAVQTHLVLAVQPLPATDTPRAHG